MLANISHDSLALSMYEGRSIHSKVARAHAPQLHGSLRYMCMTISCYDLLQLLQDGVQQLSKTF